MGWSTCGRIATASPMAHTGASRDSLITSATRIMDMKLPQPVEKKAPW